MPPAGTSHSAGRRKKPNFGQHRCKVLQLSWMSRGKAAFGLGIGLLLGTFLAGCGGGGSPSSVRPPTSGATTLPVATSVPPTATGQWKLAAQTIQSGSTPVGTGVTAATCDGTACVGVSSGAMVISSGGPWKLLAVPTGQNGETAYFTAVACAPGLCVGGAQVASSSGRAVGAILDSVRSRPGGSSIFTLEGSSVSVGGISCPTSSSCVAVGSSIWYTTNSGTSWQASVMPSLPGVGTRYGLSSVSCTSAEFCVAAVAQGGLIVTTSGPTGFEGAAAPRGWSPVASVGTGGSEVSTHVNAVSCVPGTTDCVAGGAIGTTPVMATTTNGSVWSSVILPSSVSGSESIYSVSCTLSGRCVAVGQNPASVTSSTPSPVLALFTAGNINKWQSATLPSGVVTLPTAGVPVVACGSPTYCLVSDIHARSSTSGSELIGPA